VLFENAHILKIAVHFYFKKYRKLEKKENEQKQDKTILFMFTLRVVPVAGSHYLLEIRNRSVRGPRRLSNPCLDPPPFFQ